MNKHEAIFAVARALPEAEREAYLEEVCESAEQREHVMALLRGADRGAEFLAELDETVSDRRGGEQPGTRIDRYKLLQKIGEGGMGEVWMAEQREPVERRVALKIIKAGMDTRGVVARFEAERQALAMMNHPNIAQVFDGGVTSSGRPYFVMELVHGVPVTRYCDEARLSTRERLELFREICGAVSHSHQKGIIHRDLKPSNILVTNRDDRPVPKVIDFGVAKATAQRLTEKTLFTQYGQMMGTPAYMSPEQAQFSEQDIDTRSDIYALGVLLYELLTGSTPFEDQELRHAAFDEMCRVIREVDPPRPSTKLSTLGEKRATVAALHRTDADHLQRAVRGELDWIVMKALEKDRSRRYQSAEGFGGDIGRYLRDEAVEAAAPGTAYRIRKFVRRHRGTVATATVVVASLVGGLLLALWSYAGEKEAREREEKHRKLAVTERNDKQRALVRSEGHRLSAESSLILPESPGLALLLAVEAGKRVQSPMVNGALLAALDATHEQRILVAAHSASEPQRVRDASFNHDGTRILTVGIRTELWDVVTGRRLAELKSRAEIRSARFSPDGNGIVSEEPGAVVRVWDAATGAERFSVSGGSGARFSSDGQRLAVRVGPSVRILNPVNGEELLILAGHDAEVSGAEFGADDSRLVTAAHDSTVRVWDANNGAELLRLDLPAADDPPSREKVPSARFSPDGSLILTSTTHFDGRLWDAESGAQVRELYEAPVLFRPNGAQMLALKQIVTALESNEARICDSRSGNELFRLEGHRDAIVWARYSEDGRYIVTASMDKTARIWSAENGEEVAVLRGHEETVRRARIGPGMENVVTVSDDGTTRVWHMRSGRERSTIPMGGSVSEDGELVAFRRLETHVAAWNLETGRQVNLPLGTEGGVISPDGSRILTSHGRLYDVATGRLLGRLSGTSESIAGACFSADGKRIGAGFSDHAVGVWENTGEFLARLRGHTGEVYSSEFDPDGERVLSVSADGTARIWDWRAGTELLAIEGQEAPVESASFGPHGKQVVTIGRDCVAHIRDATDGSFVAALRASGGITHAGVDSAGSKILTCRYPGENHAVDLWAFPSGEHRLRIEEGGRALLSPDGERILIWWPRQGARVHDAATGDVLVSLEEATDLSSAAFRAGTNQIIGVADGALRIWDVQSGAVVKTIAESGGGIGDVVVNVSGTHAIATIRRQGATVWNYNLKRQITTLQGGHRGDIFDIVFSPDHRRIVTASLNERACLWDVSTGKLVATLAHGVPFNGAMSFSPDGSALATEGADGRTHLWDTGSGDLMHALAVPHAEVVPTGFDARGERLLTASTDQIVRIWSVATGRELGALQSGGMASFNRDGTKVITAAGGSLPSLYLQRGASSRSPSGPDQGPPSLEAHLRRAIVWNAATGEKLQSFELDQRVFSAAISPDGALVATASGAVQLWNAVSGEKLQSLRLDDSRIDRVRFSPNGKRLLGYTHLGPGHAILWELPEGRLLFKLSRKRGTNWAGFTADGSRFHLSPLLGVGHTESFPTDPFTAALQALPRGLTGEEREFYGIEENGLP